MAIIILGDSNGQGFFDCERGGWAERLKQHMFKEKGSFVFNLSVSGYTSNHIIELIKRGELDSRIEADDEDNIVIIAVGVNDSVLINNDQNLVMIEKYMFNITNIKTMLIEKYGYKKNKSGESIKNIEILFVTPTNVDENRSLPVDWDNQFYYKNDEIKRYVKILKDICYPTATYLLNLYDDLKFETIDGVHLKPDEHEIVFQKILTAIDKLIWKIESK